MTTEEQLTKLKELEIRINQQFKADLEAARVITYREFVDKFVNPNLPDDKKLTGEPWTNKPDCELLELNFGSDSTAIPLVIDWS